MLTFQVEGYNINVVLELYFKMPNKYTPVKVKSMLHQNYSYKYNLSKKSYLSK